MKLSLERLSVIDMLTGCYACNRFLLNRVRTIPLQIFASDADPHEPDTSDAVEEVDALDNNDATSQPDPPDDPQPPESSRSFIVIIAVLLLILTGIVGLIFSGVIPFPPTDATSTPIDPEAEMKQTTLLKAEPYDTASTLDSLSAGSIYDVVGITKDDTWVLISTENRQGFVPRDSVNLRGRSPEIFELSPTPTWTDTLTPTLTQTSTWTPSPEPSPEHPIARFDRLTNGLTEPKIGAFLSEILAQGDDYAVYGMTADNQWVGILTDSDRIVYVLRESATLFGPAPAIITPSPTPTETPTPTWTPSVTNTPTETPTWTPSVTNTPTETPTWTPSVTNTLTKTVTPPPTFTDTLTLTPSDTPTPTPTFTETPTRTPTVTDTPSPFPTPTPTLIGGSCGAVYSDRSAIYRVNLTMDCFEEGVFVCEAEEIKSDGGAINYLKASSDGNHLIYENGDGGIVIVNVNTLEVQTVATEFEHIRGVSLSQDGSEFVFAAENPDTGNYDLYVQAVENGQAEILSSAETDETWVDWSPVDDQIVYLDENGHIMLIDRETGEVQSLDLEGVDLDEVSYRDVRWTLEGDRLMAIQQTPDESIIVLIDLEQMRVIPQDIGRIAEMRRPVLSPDGERILFRDNNKIWLTAPDNLLLVTTIEGNNPDWLDFSDVCP